MADDNSENKNQKMKIMKILEGSYQRNKFAYNGALYLFKFD